LNFSPPTIAWRGKVAKLLAEAQAHRPQHGESSGKLKCACGAALHFTIQSNGISRGRCAAACGVRWQQ
jgi:hypothetical protein